MAKSGTDEHQRTVAVRKCTNGPCTAAYLAIYSFRQVFYEIEFAKYILPYQDHRLCRPLHREIQIRACNRYRSIKRLLAADAFAGSEEPWSRLDNLSRKFQLLLCGESLVEFLHIGIIHIISLRCLVYTGNAIEVSRNQLLAEGKGVIRAFRQVMIADTKLTGISKAALAVESDIAFKQNSAIAESGRLLQRVSKQHLSITLAFELWSDANRPHCQDRDHLAVIRFDNRLHEHILSE